MGNESFKTIRKVSKIKPQYFLASTNLYAQVPVGPVFR